MGLIIRLKKAPGICPELFYQGQRLGTAPLEGKSPLQEKVSGGAVPFLSLFSTCRYHNPFQ